MRRLKLFLSIIIGIAMLGGIGYAIYSAASSKASDVSLVVDGQFVSINDIVKDYDKIADGEAIQLPDSNAELEALGYKKEGYTFACWSTDAKGNNRIDLSIIIKGQGPKTLYLQWEKINYDVHILTLKKEYAKNFDFSNYDNYNYYKEISITGTDYKESVAYDEYTIENFPSGDSDELGYTDAWVKWTGDGKYDVDENNNPIYYTGRQKITESCVFVKLEMPKKYMVNYVYFDEQNKEQLLAQKELVYNKASDTIIRSDVSYARNGYSRDSMYLKNDTEDTFNLTNNQVINESVLNFVGTTVKEIKCYINYIPKNYALKIIGYDMQNQVIASGGQAEINISGSLAYYSNLYEHLYNTVLNNVNKEYLEFVGFVYKDNDQVVNTGDTMPYCHKDNPENIITSVNPLEIKAIYNVKEYDVNVYLQLKDDTVPLSLHKYRYNAPYNFDDFVNFAQAQTKVIDSSYNIDEFEFIEYVVDVDGEQEVVTNQADLELKEYLIHVKKPVRITLTTKKNKFFLELVNNGVNSNNPLNKQEHRIQIVFDSQGKSSYVNPDPESYTDFKISSLPTPYVTGRENDDLNNVYTFGGWLCTQTDIFGNYAYINDDYSFNQSDVVDDVTAEAVWYYNDTDGDVSSIWYWTKNDDDTLTITGYNRSTPYIAIPSALYERVGENSVLRTVTQIGDGARCVIKSGVKKVLIPKTVKQINSYAFACNFNDVEVRFEDGGTEDLTINQFAFSASYINDGFTGDTGVSSVYLPSRLIQIDEGAFACNTKLENVEINSANVAYKTQTTTVVDANNQKQKGQVVYKTIANNKLELVHYCMKNTLTTFEIPANVTKIYSYAFAGVDKYTTYDLRNITIELVSDSNDLQYIGDYAFAFSPRLSTVLLNTMPNLTHIGTHLFDGSFTAKPDIKANLDFKVIAFDFNNQESIPEYMFNNANNLQGIDFIHVNNISSIGEFALFNVGNDYVTSDYVQYLTYEKVALGFKNYLYNNYGVNVTEGNYNDLKDKFSTYLQSFIVYKTLNYVGERAFHSNSTKSIFTMYTNTSGVSFIGPKMVDGVKVNNAFVGYNAFGGDGKIAIYSLAELNKDVGIQKNNVQEILITEATIGYQGFDVVLVNKGIKFVDCEFLGTTGSHQNYEKSFQHFTIRDTDFENLTDEGKADYTPVYSFVVEYTADSTIKYLPTNVLKDLNITKACNFVLNVNSAIDDFELNAASLQGINCKIMRIYNVATVANTAFAVADTSFRQPSSAEHIEFYNCSFDINRVVGTDAQTQQPIYEFRDLMFYNLGDIKTITFVNCPLITKDFFIVDENDETNYQRTQNKLKTASCQNGDHKTTYEKLGSDVTVVVDFTQTE